MATEENSKKKRLIRPSQDAKNISTVEAQVSPETLKVKSNRQRNLAMRTLVDIFRPIFWLLRHIIPRYIRNSFAELRQVTWPNRKQSRQLTTAVVLFSIVFGFLVATLDYGLDKLFKKVFLKE